MSATIVSLGASGHWSVELADFWGLSYRPAFLPQSARHSNLQASSRRRPIARDRRGLLLGKSLGTMWVSRTNEVLS
jgi:hypothetical protein